MVNESTFQGVKIRYLVLWIILFFIVMTGLILASHSLLKGAEWSVAYGLLVYALISYWMLRNFRKINLDYSRFIGHIPINYNWLFLLTIVFAVILFSLGMNELTHFIISTIDPGILGEIPRTSLFYTPQDTPLAPFMNLLDFLTGVIAAPIVEELLFRGVMLHRFTFKLGLKKAILTSSIIFGLLHADFIGAFVFGMVMCILYIKTGTLIIPIIGHMLNNLLAYGMQMLSNINQQNSALVSSTPHPNIGVAAFLLIVAGMIILYFLYRNWPRAYWNPPYFQQDYQGVQENYYY
ncbi:MAG: CPBP family intramembrane metalloprotease [Methanobacteriales archaeon HGW-Methanobacteriales-2]|nr:MAG: CPBP family intramembrane metalloprotease [Methanobacteriales archaeon HGW-Methanobacteriales-2]